MVAADMRHSSMGLSISWSSASPCRILQGDHLGVGVLDPVSDDSSGSSSNMQLRPPETTSPDPSTTTTAPTRAEPAQNEVQASSKARLRGAARACQAASRTTTGGVGALLVHGGHHTSGC